MVVHIFDCESESFDDYISIHYFWASVPQSVRADDLLRSTQEAEEECKCHGVGVNTSHITIYYPAKQHQPNALRAIPFDNCLTTYSIPEGGMAGAELTRPIG